MGTSKSDEKVVVTRNLSTSSNPALIVEIIEKEPKHESMDPDGYKVVKGKTKTRDKRKSKEIPESSIEAIINQLDQPIDDKKVISHADVMSPVLSDEFEMIEQEDEKCISSKSEKVLVKGLHKQVESVHSSQDDDPWLAVKQEYTRKDSSTKKETDTTDSVDYTIEVKVTTKETCLGRRLHDQDTTEWKMDVQCTQKNTMPDIIEAHDGQNSSITATGKDSKHTSHTNLSDKKFNSLPRLKTKALSPERLCLSPSWMRKDLSRTQSVESNLGSEAGGFGSVNRKFSDSRTSCFTSSAETLDEHDDDVYWRLKHKVKKKKRRNQSGPSDAKSRENNELLFASTKDSLEPLCPFVEPIIETKEESSIIVNSSINIIEEMESETTKTIDASVAKTSTAHTSMEKANRKISTSQKTITNERTISMDMDAMRKESVSPMQIDKQSSISVPLESVAESNMKKDISGNIKSVKTSVTKEEMHLADTPQLEIKIDQPKSVAAPSIVLQNEAESKMVGATEIIRATSPMINQSRPQFKRQNSKEMQLAVEVQRPISFEKQTSLKAENVGDAWMNESAGSMDDDELDKELNEETKRKSWSSIAANVVSKVAKPKNESISRKTSSHETLIVQAEDDTRSETSKSVDKDGFEICVGKKEMRQKRKSQNLDSSDNKKEEIIQPSCKETKPAIAGLPMDDASDAWMNDDVGTIDSESEDETVQAKESTLKELATVQAPTKDVKPAIAGLPMTDASDAWMDDDVGTIMSDSEDEIENIQESEKFVPNEKQQTVDPKKSYAGLPTDTVTDAWMNDDLGSLDSEEEEEAKPLALTGPSWAGTASKTSVSGSKDTELPRPPRVVPLKPSKPETFILEAEGKEQILADVELDSEGFKEALSRKVKRERKTSKRISLSMDDLSKDTDSENEQLAITDESHHLAIKGPSWAGIAPKHGSSCSDIPDLPKTPQLVTLKHSKSQALIVEANDETNTDEGEVDEEGFELAVSRKVKRDRKISKRISLSIDEEDIADKLKETETESVGLPTKGNSLIMNLSMDSFWVCKHIFDDAEERYFSQKKIDAAPTKEMIKNNKKDDEDKDDNDDDKDFKKDSKRNKRTQHSEPNKTNEEVETMEYNWTDESTYLSPNIPVMKPMKFKICTPNDNIQIESHLTKTAQSLSNTIKNHMREQNNMNKSEAGEHIIGLSSQHKDDDLRNSLQVDMDNLQTAVANIDDTLQRLNNEEIDGQLAVVKYTLKTLEELESEAISIEARLQKLPSGSDVDMMSLSATLTGNRTKLVTLHTQAEAQKARIERYMIERRKRITEIKRYQALLVDLEQWLGEAQATISMEIKLTSVKIVRDQIRASESLEQDLRSRSTQLEHLLKEIQQLVGYVDVQPLVHDMTSNLGSLHGVMEDAQQCLEHRLKNLQDILRKMVIGYPEGTDLQKELAASPGSEQSKGSLPDLEAVRSEKDDIGDDWEVVDESLMNVQVDFSATEPNMFKIQSPSLDESSLGTSASIENTQTHTETINIVQNIEQSSEIPESATAMPVATTTVYEVTFVGKLKLNVRQAKELEKKDVFQKADPYVIVNFGSFSSKSKKVKNTLNPAWNHEITLDIDRLSPKQIEFQLFDWERFGKDEPMGIVSLPVENAISLSQKPSSWLDLSECKSGKLLISSEFIGETFKVTRTEKGAKDLRKLLKSDKSDSNLLTNIESIPKDENDPSGTQKVITNVTRKVTTTKRVLRRVVIDADAVEHVTEEIIEEPNQITNIENTPSIVIEDTSQVSQSQFVKESASKESFKTSESSSQKEWVNIPIVRLDKIPTSPGVEIEELSDEEFNQSIQDEPIDLSTRLNVEGLVTTPSDDESNLVITEEIGEIEEINDEPIDLTNKHKPLSNESSISSASSVVTVVEVPGYKRSESTLSLDEDQPSIRVKPPSGKSKNRTPSRPTSMENDSKLVKAEAAQHRDALRKKSESSGDESEKDKQRWSVNIPIIKVKQDEETKENTDATSNSNTDKSKDDQKRWSVNIPITRMTDSKASSSKQGVKNVQEILKKEIDINPVSTETAKVKDNDNENEKGAKELRRLLMEERSANSNIINLESKETEKITGTIRLNIQKARDLKNLDIVGKSDPYVVIKCGDQKSKSKKRKNTLNPEWNFSTDISLNGPDNSIFLEIFDKDKIGKDESMGSRTIDTDTLHLLRTKGATWLKLDDNTPGEVLISGDFSTVQLISSKQSTIETSNKKSDKVSQDSKTTGVPEHQKTTSDQNIAISKESGGAKEVKRLLEKAESQVNEDTQGGTVQIGASKTTQNVSKVIASQSSSEIINQVSSSQISDIRQISHEVTDNNTNISSAKESQIIPKMGVDGQTQSFTSVTTSVAESSQVAHQVNTDATLELSSSIVHQVSLMNPVQNTSQLSHQVTDNSKDTTSSVSHTVIQSGQLGTANYPLQDNIETLTEPTHSVSSLDTYSQVAHQVTEGSDHTSSSPQLHHGDREGAVTSSSND